MAFRGSVFQGQVQNPGVGSGINAISTSNYALQGLINNQANNRNRLLNTALGVGGKVFTDQLAGDIAMDKQKDQQKADVDLLKMKLPFDNATKQASLLNAAQSAEDNNDPNTAAQLRAFAAQFGGMGGFGTTPGIAPPGGQEEGQSYTSSNSNLVSDVTGRLPANNGFTVPGALNENETGEFNMPAPENFSGFKGTYTGQENQADVAKKTQEAQTAKFNMTSVNGLDRASKLPNGITLKDQNNIKFINLKTNDTVRNLFREGRDLKANKSDEVIKMETAINQDQAVFDLLADKMKILEQNLDFPSSGDRGGLEKGLRAAGNMFFNTPMADANKTFVAFQNNPRLEDAQAAAESMEITVNGIAKKLQDGGVVTKEDAAQAKSAMPGLTELSAKALKAKKQDFADLLLRPMMNTAIKLGNAHRYNQIQKTYKKFTGNFAQIGDSGEPEVTNEAVTTPARNNAPITEDNVVDENKMELGGANSIPIGQMNLQDLLSIDETTLTPDDQTKYLIRLKQLKNGKR
jgi:hypothetical protein